MIYTSFKIDLAEIILVGDQKGLSFLHLNADQSERKLIIQKEWERDNSFFLEIISQLKDYFKGKRKKFNIKINPQGTDFQLKVWRELVKIPFGKSCSYQDIALLVGGKNFARAVGMANNKNPIPLIIPCHRVIGKNGSLTGFAHGLDMKQKLLQFERETV